LEIFQAVGFAGSASQAEWDEQEYPRDEKGNLSSYPSERSAQWTYDHSTMGTALPFYRIGFHLGARSGGPWLEGEMGKMDLFHCPVVNASWGFRYFQLGGGWLRRTSRGDLTLFARTLVTNGSVIPTIGVQWSADAPVHGAGNSNRGR
jgi:hypothetical protein